MPRLIFEKGPLEAESQQSGHQASSRPWGCAIVSFVFGMLFLAGLLVILFFTAPKFRTEGKLPTRPEKSTQVLAAALAKNFDAEIRLKRESTELLVDMLYARQQEDPDCTMDFLILSGGGEHGAFGAGFLLGWSKVAQGEHAMPAFDGVTGVSAGSYIAPFAYLGTPEALETINTFFRNPKPDWSERRGALFFLPQNASFTTVPGLERDLQTQMSLEFAKKIEKASTVGRLLLIQATNLDESIPHAFNFVDAARTATALGDSKNMREILLASSAIPVLFPPRIIDGTLYVDGGVGCNFYYGGRPSIASETFGGIWKRKHPDAPIPKTRYSVVLNGTLRARPEVVPPRWPNIAERSVFVSVGTTEVIALRGLFAMADITRMRGDGEVEVRWIAIPEGFVEPGSTKKLFDKATMRALSDEGKRLGGDPGSWNTTSP